MNRMISSGSKALLLSVAAVVAFSACGGGGGSSSTSSTTSLGGEASNLPFKKGATVTCSQVGGTSSVSTTTSDDNGTYTCSGISWTGATKVEVDGAMPDATNAALTTSGSVKLVTNLTGSNKTANVTTLTTLAAPTIEASVATATTTSALDDLITSASNVVLAQFFGTGYALPTGVKLEDLNPLAASSTNDAVNALNANLLVMDVKLDKAALNNGSTPINYLNQMATDIKLNGAIVTSSVTTMMDNVKTATALDVAAILDLVATNSSNSSKTFTTTNGYTTTAIAAATAGTQGLTFAAYTAAASQVSGIQFNPAITYSGALTQSGSALSITVSQPLASNSVFTLAGTDGRSGLVSFSATTVTVTGGSTPATGITVTYIPAAAQSLTSGYVDITATNTTNSSVKSTTRVPYTALLANSAPTAKGGSFNVAETIELNLSASTVTADADGDALKYFITNPVTRTSGYAPYMGWGSGFTSTSAWSGSSLGSTGMTFTGDYLGLIDKWISTGAMGTTVASGMTFTSGTVFTNSNVTATGGTNPYGLGNISLANGKVKYTRPGYGSTVVGASVGFTGTFGFGYAVIDSKGYGRVEIVDVGVNNGYTNTSQ